MSDEERDEIEELERELEAIGWQLVHEPIDSETAWRAERRAGSIQRSEASMSRRGLLRSCRETEDRLQRQGVKAVQVHTGIESATPSDKPKTNLI